MNCSMPGLPVHYQLPEFTQTHVHWVRGAIQPSPPLSSPSPPAFNFPIALTRWAFAGKVMSLLFNMMSRLVTTFLPRSKHLLISWLQSPSAVILALKKIVCHRFHCFPSICHEMMGPDVMILAFWVLSFKPNFSLPSFTFIKRPH